MSAISASEVTVTGLGWTSALEVPNDAINAQHKELFERLACLDEAVRQGSSREAVEDALAFLCAYVAEHFTAEEALMEAAGYPGLGTHQTLHAELAERVEARTVGWIARGELDDRGLVQDLYDWIATHVLGADLAVAEFLRTP